MSEPLGLSDLIRVRIGHPTDESEIYEMACRLHAENGLFSICEEKVRAFFQKMLHQKDGIIGVIGEQGKIEAALCLQIGCDWYSDVLYLQEIFNYCKPEYRNSNNAKLLIEFAKACSLATQMPLMIGILSNQRTEAKIRLYQRRLGKSSGAFWLHGATTGSEENHVRGQ